MYIIEDIKSGKVITKMFARKLDYDRYRDYLKNGLKMVHSDCSNKACKLYEFNDGSVLYLILSLETNEYIPILYKDNNKYRDERYVKKYVELTVM